MVLHNDTRGVTGFHIRKANWQLNKRASVAVVKIKKGDTDIEIGGFEPQTGDFENKAQNTYKMIF